MISLNVGNLWTNEFLDEVIKLNNQHNDIQITSLFGSGAGITPTARSGDRLPYLTDQFISDYINKAQSNNISIRWTLNQSCIGSTQDFYTLWEHKLKKTLIHLHDLGVHQWTIASPLVMELMHTLFPNDLLEVSTIAEVSTPEEAARWDLLGASAVNISTSINRDFNRIKQIKRVFYNTTILANEACLYRCPWRRECYNLSSHDSLRSEKLFNFYPFNRCNTRRIENPVEWLHSRLVLPQWMQIYSDLVDINNFKISFRTHPISVALPILKLYMSQQHDGNLLDLWPTVSTLGNTPEPSNSTYISCKKLDQINFLSEFIDRDCSYSICDITCKVCKNAYEYAKQ